MYKSGDSIDQNDSTAVEWFRKASMLVLNVILDGCMRRRRSLKIIQYECIGIAKNRNKAMQMRKIILEL